MLPICSALKPRRLSPSALMPCGAGGAADHHVGRHVLADARVLAHEAVRAGAAELVQPREAAENGPVADLAMPGQADVVGQDHVVAHHAVVRDVRVGHDPVVVADPRHALVLGRAAIDGDALADGIAIADHQPGRLTRVLLVLRLVADGGKLEDAVVPADDRRALQTTCGPIRVPAPISTPWPMTEYGPISTLSWMRASAATIAVG
jgi:hypothetical protein